MKTVIAAVSGFRDPGMRAGGPMSKLKFKRSGLKKLSKSVFFVQPRSKPVQTGSNRFKLVQTGSGIRRAPQISPDCPAFQSAHTLSSSAPPSAHPAPSPVHTLCKYTKCASTRPHPQPAQSNPPLLHTPLPPAPRAPSRALDGHPRVLCTAAVVISLTIDSTDW